MAAKKERRSDEASALWAELKSLCGDNLFRADDSNEFTADVIRFPSHMLGEASGFWGIPLGKLTHIYGVEGCGKSFLCYLLAKQTLEQFPDSEVVWIDAEQSFNLKWVRRLGIDPSKIRVVKSSEGDEIFHFLLGKHSATGNKTNGFLDYVAEGALKCKLIVLDSVNQMIAPAETTRNMDQVEMSASAKFLARALKKLIPQLARSKVAFVALNQARDKIGSMIPMITYAGGRAFRHAASLTIKLQPSMSEKGKLLVGDVKVGHKILAEIEKTRGAVNGRKVEFWFDFATENIGVAKKGIEVIRLAKDYNIPEVKGSGAWFEITYDGKTQKIQGEEKAGDYLESNPEIIEFLIQKIKDSNPTSLERSASTTSEHILATDDFAGEKEED